MQRVGSWLQKGGVKKNSSSPSLNALDEAQDLHDAMRGASLIMNDDVDGAEESLRKGNSSFHKLGRGVVTFLRATLGFEQEIMKEASERLADAESSAANDHSRAVKSGRAYETSIYATGSEYALCTVEAQIMAAVVGVLNESLTESIRGFYKIRKAFITLESLLAMETKFAKEQSAGQSRESFTSNGSSRSTATNLTGIEKTQIPKSPSPLQDAEVTSPITNDDIDIEEDFADAEEETFGGPTPTTYEGHIDFDQEQDPPKYDDIAKQPGQEGDAGTDKAKQSLIIPKGSELLDLDPESPAFSNPLDGFIHSGVNLCFGLLLLLISTIPPAFSKLLYIIGFRGDKEKGMLLLWQASKFHNIHGAMAALVLLGWYNALVGFCDIVPDPSEDSTPETQIEGYPTLRLKALLSVTSQRFPKSQLWLLERARMASSQRQLSTALDLLRPPCTSPLKQVAALHMFEKALNAMYAHEHTLCAESFIACVDLNSWSRGLYYYIAGAANLALYRKLRDTDPKQAMKHAKEAESHFKTAPSHTGKKKIMARQLPFDMFVSRKIQKWEQRAKDRGVPFIEAIGVSPSEEMCYLWNGYRKMNSQQLEESLDILSWSDNPETNPTWTKESRDEQGILAVLRAAIYRNLRRHDEAKALLKKEVIDYPKTSFKGNLKDDWVAPVAHYEVGVNLWMERTGYQRIFGTELITTTTTTTTTTSEKSPLPPPTSIDLDLDLTHDRPFVSECKSHIEKVRNWESYDLDSRIGLKVTSAWDAVGKWEARYGG